MGIERKVEGSCEETRMVNGKVGRSTAELTTRKSETSNTAGKGKGKEGRKEMPGNGMVKEESEREELEKNEMTREGRKGKGEAKKEAGRWQERRTVKGKSERESLRKN